ncbi:MAG: DUF6502 family protein [Woeseiaceae bacterium]|nr:DUF6502 family protein [Woeseiaceae bacterium]
MLQDIVIDSCRHLLRPIVRFLLRQGVQWKEFAELAKEVYVETARAEYGIEGRPTNNSRVAMLTGLSRREVGRVRDVLLEVTEHDDERQGSRLARILTGWHTDPDFVSTDGTPRNLDAAAFEDLLNRYAGDLPHTAIRKELLAHRLIEELDGAELRVLERDFVYSSVDPEIVRQLGVALHDHAGTLDHNLNNDRISAPRFEGIADNVSIPATAVDEFEQFVEERGMAFLEAVDAWLAEHQTNEHDAKTVRLGAGAYLIRND